MSKGVMGPTGEMLAERHIKALAWLGRFPDGASAVAGGPSGGVLAALVSLGVAQRAPKDRAGGGRWVINAAGRALLASPGAGE